MAPAPHKHLPLIFQPEVSERGTAADCALPRPPRHQSTLCARTPGSLMGERSPPSARRAPRQPVLALPWPSLRLPRSVNLRLPPGRWAMATPRPPARPQAERIPTPRTAPGAFQWNKAAGRPGCPPPRSFPASSLKEAAPTLPLAPELPPLLAAPTSPPPGRCLPGLAPPSPSSQSVRLFSMVAAPRRARGWLRRLARAPLPAFSALSLALALARPPLHGGRSCSARPPGAHTLAHGHTLTPARAPSQRRRCSPHPVCRRREPLAGFGGGGAGEGGRRGEGRAGLGAPSH